MFHYKCRRIDGLYEFKVVGFEILFIDENQVCTIVYYSELGMANTCDIGQE